MARALGIWLVVLAIGCGSETSDGGGASGSAGSGGSAASSGSSGSGGSGATAGGGGSAAGGSAGNLGSAGASGSGGAPTHPADWLALESWKLTLPIAAPGESKPLEILQPELASFSHDPWFRLNDSKDGVVFRAHAGGVTTSNSGYPRSELREMAEQGSELAAWSTTSGKHSMTITQAISALPTAKPHVVAGQIHDDSDDVVMIRLEGEHLFVEGGGDELGTLDPAYTLGQVFDLKLVAENGEIHVFYQDLAAPKVSVSRDASGCYFKAGAYTQSNTSTGDDADAYGEVVIHALSVLHE